MQKAKFKSKTTYHNYLKDLNDWGYLKYFPSYHPAQGSIVEMYIFFSSDGQKLANSVPEPGQNLVSSYKHKTIENFNKLARPKNELVVLKFFKENNWPAMEGKKFYAHFEAKGWELSRGLKITNWKTAASNFVEKGIKIREEIPKPNSGQQDNLRKYDNRDKNYGMPL
ncbi:hypothetical protein [Leeuwenhoekiella marinoflava]|nr:hypothetical protein [Leeuwenhoekiella marinoflava]